MKSIILIIGLGIFSGCTLSESKVYPLLEVVQSVDIVNYSGKWYEITSILVSQQKENGFET